MSRGSKAREGGAPAEPGRAAREGEARAEPGGAATEGAACTDGGLAARKRCAPAETSASRVPVAHRIVLWPVAHPWTVLAAICICAALSVLSILRLRPDVSVEALFANHDPSAAALARVLGDFPAAEQLIVLASLPDNSPGADPRRLLEFGRRFADAVHGDPAIAKLTNGVFYQAGAQDRGYVEKVIGPAAMFYLDPPTFRAAQQRLSTGEIRKQIAQDRALLAAPGPAAGAFAKMVRQDPLRLHEFIMDRLAGQRPFRTYDNGDAFISPDGRALLVRVQGRQPPSNLEFCQAVTAGAKRAGGAANTDGLQLEYTGAYAIAALSQRSIRRDMITSVIGSVLLLQLLFLVAYRRPFKLFALAFGPVAMGILLGFGVYGLISATITPITAVLGAILAGMGIDYSIQYISYYEGRRASNVPASQAAAQAAIVMGPAVLAAWATSVIGFLAIGCSRVQALRQFALLGTLGLSGAFICAAAVLPAVLMLTDARPHSGAVSRLRFEAGRLVRSLSRRRRAWLCASLLVLAGALVVIGRSGGNVLPLESDLTVMHPRPNPAIDAQQHVAQRFGISPGSMLVYLHASSPAQLLELAYQAHDRLNAPSVRAAGVAGSFGLATLLPDPRTTAERLAAVSSSEAGRVVADFNAALSDNGFAPRAFTSYAKFLRVLLTQQRVPGVTDLLAYPRVAENVLPASAFHGIPPTEALTLVFVNGALDLDHDRAARDRLIDSVRGALSGLPGAVVTGLGVVGHDTQQTIRQELPRLILAAILIVAAYLTIHFRSIPDALFSLLPAIFGMIVAAAILRMSGQKLNMINLIAIPLLIGIDVDYGIFLVSLARWRRIRRENADEAAHRIEPAVHAVALCATATILGYVSLIWTSVPAERSLGIAAAAGIGACLVGVLFLLAPLLLKSARVARAASP